MALYQERLAGPVAVTNTASASTLPAEGSATYTVPASTTTIVKQIMLTNISAETRRITMWLKPSATAYASITTANCLYYDYEIGPYATALLNLSLVMDVGDRIYVRTGTASTVNITINGIHEQ